MNKFEGLPTRRRFRWDGRRWRSVRFDHALWVGVWVALVLVLGLIGLGFVARMVEVMR